MNDEVFTPASPITSYAETSTSWTSKKRKFDESQTSQTLSSLFEDSLCCLQRPQEKWQFTQLKSSSRTLLEVESEYDAKCEKISSALREEDETETDAPSRTKWTETQTLTSKPPPLRRVCRQEKCTEPDCLNTQAVRTKGLCFKHYQRNLRQERRNGIHNNVYSRYTAETKTELVRASRTSSALLLCLTSDCIVENCRGKVRCKGMCEKHYCVAVRADRKRKLSEANDE